MFIYKTVLENSNHFSKQYWEKGDNSLLQKTVGPEYWMIESEKEHRQNVFQNKCLYFFEFLFKLFIILSNILFLNI